MVDESVRWSINFDYYFLKMLTSVYGIFLSTLIDKFLKKSCILNALEIVIVDFLKE